MHSAPLVRLHHLLLSIALCAALASPVLRAADAAPTVARSASSAPVTVTADDTAFTLSNGIVTAHINKRNGSLDQVIYKGVDRAGHDQGAVGVWEQDPSAAAASSTKR